MSGFCRHCDRRGVRCGPAACAAADPTRPYTLDACRPCWVRLSRRPPGQPATGAGLCRHLGAVTGQTILCPECRGGAGTQLKLFACAVHGDCTTERRAPGHASCPTCPDFEAPPALMPTVRNLLYHVYPVRGDVWRWNVAQLLRRIGLFNGRRIVAVVTDGVTDHPDEVRRALGGNVDDVVVTQNVPELREVATFEPLFSRVKSLHPSHCTFYGHAKGVVRPGQLHVRTWAEMLYAAHLDYWPAVEGLLGERPLAGCFKKLGRGWPDHESAGSLWHYSGSFLWFRNRDLFSRPDWTRIDRCWTGIEPYPSLHFTAGEAGVIFCEGPVGAINMYNAGYVDRAVGPAWRRWQDEHAADRKEW